MKWSFKAVSMQESRALSQEEIKLLEKNGCTAGRWQSVRVSADFDATRVRHTAFYGTVRIGSNRGQVTTDGVTRPCGIYYATIADCTIGSDVYIARTGSAIRNYVIEDKVYIEDVSSMMTEGNVTFGNGVSIEVLNETGGREVTLFNEMNAQIAYAQAFYRHDPDFQRELQHLIEEYVSHQRADRGVVGRAVKNESCGHVRNTNIGPHAVLRGALRIEDGTVLSCAEHPTFIGAGVIMDHFILSEGSSVDSGAVLSRVFVGQGAQVGKQCSIENSLIFANSEAFHSEICSVFAGPYTVTHHKSTLLIASLWSFYNAGSGTNQSNHMYKLGPVHQGIFERGCKTGSFAYNMMECHIPAFTAIIGKHMANIDIPDFPFSYLYEEEGRSCLIMGMNIFSIGTVRDAEKWPARDRRKAPVKRDQIIFDVFSPFTVEKMRRGRRILQDLYKNMPREEEGVYHGGVFIKRLLMRKGIRYYTLAIDRYLLGRYFDRIEELAKHSRTWAEIWRGCDVDEKHAQSAEWVDMGGLLISKERLSVLMESVRNRSVRSVTEFLRLLEEIHRAYAVDEWGYIYCIFAQEYGAKPTEVEPALFLQLIEKWSSAVNSLSALVLENTKSEFSGFSNIGYGVDWGKEERSKDFQAVRGTYEKNPIVQKLIMEKQKIESRVGNITRLIKEFA